MSQPAVVILAIDPGPDQSGFCYLADGEVCASGVQTNPGILDMLCRGPSADVLAIEEVRSYGMPVGKEVFDTVRWTGRYQQAWRDPEAVRLVPRLAVKLHLCHSVRAKDGNVWAALLDRFGPVGTKAAPGKLYAVRSHARAALALAVTVSDQLAAEPMGRAS